ncbi:MAG: RecQ family ATP-dependent DNA helicase [Bacteroidales bacterium]|nr:RecQ family ATP-dependent DNA helicase [Bacteroidales bacterium]
MDEYHSILSRYWGYEQFRPLQREISLSVAAGRDTLGLMPTGGGKSITFQVFSLSRPGLCIVITPLISLMKDQVENLRRRNIKALTIHSGMTQQEVSEAFDNAAWGNYKFLYLSPERIGTEQFKERLQQMSVNLIVVDEAHCISQWGYDFRPSYLRIKDLRPLLPDLPVLALTATATPDVVRDIQRQLNFRKENVLKMSFYRSNLCYMVRHREDKLAYLLTSVQKAHGTGIIYVRSRKNAKDIADYLQKHDISADYYHAGLTSGSRSQKQDNWQNNRTRIIVATNAFGMGIDKPDVRFVIHFGPSNSPEAYFQEAGRAGRDGKKAYAVLIADSSDSLTLQANIKKSFPPPEEIIKVYESLGNYYQIAAGFGRGSIHTFKIGDFAGRYHYPIDLVDNCLKILQREGYIELTDESDHRSRVHFIVNRDELYNFQMSQPEAEEFMRTLLRSGTGFFSGYTEIDENFLAQKTGLSVETIYGYLKHLRTHKIIEYIPRQKFPYLIFTKERIATPRVNISKTNYYDRLQDFTRRIEAMTRYMQDTTKCRSQLLLDYFGETDSQACGQCDVCIAAAAAPVSASAFRSLADRIKAALTAPATPESVLKAVNAPEKDITDTVRQLMDAQIIETLPDGRLKWHEK